MYYHQHDDEKDFYQCRYIQNRLNVDETRNNIIVDIWNRIVPNINWFDINTNRVWISTNPDKISIRIKSDETSIDISTNKMIWTTISTDNAN